MDPHLREARLGEHTHAGRTTERLQENQARAEIQGAEQQDKNARAWGRFAIFGRRQVSEMREECEFRALANIFHG